MPDTETRPLTWPQRLFCALLGLVSACIIVPAFYEIFETATSLLRPYMHRTDWIVPVSAEVAFMALFGWGILLAWRKVADVPVRVAGMALLITGSVALQAYAGRSAFPDLIGHLVVVGAFFVVSLTVKAVTVRLRGGKTRGDRLGLGEWLASPARAAGLWRWKNAWAESSAAAARQRYLVLLYVIAVAQAALAQEDERAGRPRRSTFRWRRRLPVTLRYELSTGLLPAAIAAGAEGWQEAAEAHVWRQLSPLASQHAAAEPEPVLQAPAPAVPEALPRGASEAVPEAVAAPRPRAASEARTGPALKLPASKSRSMSAADLEPHVSAMLEAYGTVPEARVKKDLHVGTEKAREALRLARKNRMASASAVGR